MPCLDEQRLRSLAFGEGTGDELSHVERCASCRQALSEISTQTLDSQRTLRREGPPEATLTEGREVGSYVVRRRLGAGAMGAVYAAWDPRLEREVALKVLHLDGDLLAEARLLAKLSHPHVVAVHEVFSWSGRAVLVMELVEGQTLRSWFKTSNATMRQRFAVLQQCAEGLAAAHAAGIVHRDFKPDNVLVDGAGRARLVDFGLALHGRVGGGLAGSPAYLPLLQLQGAPADARSDQFAWWVSVYEAVSGRLVHDAPTLDGLIAVRAAGQVDLSSVPRWLRGALTRGLSNDPARRFESMHAAAKALEPPKRARVVAAVVALVAVAAFAWPARSVCDDLEVAPDALSGRATVPALAQAVRDYAAAQVACRALPAREQVDRASCLSTVGRELDVALDAVTDVAPELAPRVLKRVRPAARCEKAPLPLPPPLEPNRETAVASLRAQLRFDELRASGDVAQAAAHATQHAEATRDAGVTVRAWAGLDEASGWSMTGRTADTLTRLRGLEGLEGLGLREQTWVALGRWMFECYASSPQHCQVAERQARRALVQLDEPWANAFGLEVEALISTTPPSVRRRVETWKALPGGEYEAGRAVSNELVTVLRLDDRVRRGAALALAHEVPPNNPRGQRALLQLELDAAISDGDLARASQVLTAFEALPGDAPDLRNDVFEARWMTLVARDDSAGVLALLARSPSTEPRARYRRLIMEFNELTRLRSPRAAERRQQLELMQAELPENDLAFLETSFVNAALFTGDTAALAELPVTDEDALWRSWQEAVLARDAVAERRVYDDARALPNDVAAQWLLLEEALEAGRFEAVADAAPKLRALCTRATHDAHLRLAEAWARWKLGQRDEACRVAVLQVLRSGATPRQVERLRSLQTGCPVVGVSAWPR